MKLKIITQRDLVSIHKNNFGMKNTSTDTRRELGSSNELSKSVEVFSVSRLKELERISEENKYIIHRKCTTKEGKDFWNDINQELVIRPIRTILEKKERQKQLEKKSKNGELNVVKAKQFPITDLIEFKNKVAKCIFHNDKRPSMYFYPKTNTVYCFSCMTYADSIKVYQTLNNCDFVTAVKALS